jgi:hypothetical protein
MKGFLCGRCSCCEAEKAKKGAKRHTALFMIQPHQREEALKGIGRMANVRDEPVAVAPDTSAHTISAGELNETGNFDWLGDRRNTQVITGIPSCHSIRIHPLTRLLSPAIHTLRLATLDRNIRRPFLSPVQLFWILRLPHNFELLTGCLADGTRMFGFHLYPPSPSHSLPPLHLPPSHPLLSRFFLI